MLMQGPLPPPHPLHGTLMYLPEKGCSKISPAPGPADATAFEPASSAAVVTAEKLGENLGANSTASNNAAVDVMTTGGSAACILFFIVS